MPENEQDFQRGGFKRKHLSAPMLKEFISTHCICDPYKLEIYKGCWHQQLKLLRVQHFGELPDDAVQTLYATFSCKFGCPPPVTPASVFVEMHEVPRPKKTATSKYDSFEATYGTPTPLDLPPLQPGAVRELAPPGTFDKEKVQGIIYCVSCQRPRCVYVKTKLCTVVQAGAAPQSTLKDMLIEAIEANQATYSCGADLDLTGFAALSDARRPYVRLKLDCSQHLELQLYSSNVLPIQVANQMCGYCGEDGAIRDEDGGEAAMPLPVCEPCMEQHKKARSSGRKAPRFDRSGQRQGRAMAAQRRRMRIDDAQNNAEQAQQARAADVAGEGSSASAATDAVDDVDAEPGMDQGCVEESEMEEEESSDAEEPHEEEYFVKEIKDVRVRGSQLQFLIEWEDYPEEQHYTWEPVRNLPNDKDKIANFKDEWIASGKCWPQVKRRRSSAS